MNHVEMRNLIIKELKGDLWGPEEYGDNETIDETPTTKYMIGILSPGGEVSEVDSENGLDSENDTDTVLITETQKQYIATATPVHKMKPSSMGLTCELANDTTEIEFGVNYGVYIKDGLQYSRVAVCETGKIDLSQPSGQVRIGGDSGLTKPDSVFKWLCRRTVDRIILTVFLINLEKREESSENPERCMFQCLIQLKGREGERPFISRRFSNYSQKKNREDFIFRNYHEFAVGHGCSVLWGDSADDHTDSITTTFIPSVEIPTMQHRDIQGLEMGSFYKSNSPEECVNSLSILAAWYEEWINGCSQKVEPQYSKIAGENIEKCKDTLERIREGISKLITDPDAFQAFCFADRAMMLQRAHTVWSLQNRKGITQGTGPVLDGHKWRPFQIGFILANLAGIIDPGHPDRAIADLLWFPTGGGKTEAYLGLAAFSMAYRRLAFPESYDGVDVIMRYTLRLLSSQQFQRASTLICACEVIRRENKKTWGERPFLIGLWLGMSTTPNNMDDTREALNDLIENPKKDYFENGNPVQLVNCPWCGRELSPSDYSIDDEKDWLLIHCPRKGCIFNDAHKRSETAIPVVLIDENIYRRLPSLVIGTVDKFARLPWEPRIGALFGHVNAYCTGHGWITTTDNHPKKRCNQNIIHNLETGLVPPTLIIQDELHLVSGPLGTMMGLYETAADILCSCTERIENHLPKIIASTATIKGADSQVKGLFARKIIQFPSNGIDIDDNGFARTLNLDEYPGRCYLGIFAPGKSVKTALLRVYAVIMNTVFKAKIEGVEDEILDPYWTLIGYFNSIRELGGARRLVEDDIPKRLEYLAAKTKVKRKISLCRQINHFDEITARKKSKEIPDILQKLDLTVGTANVMDVILASNMISVGMDIDRLGIMVVNGQPKSTAEYIQAGSRIGRQYPGLVVTVYNWSRPRDISHFEKFKAYHQVFYKFVEPTSVTPYSSRARDRALHAVLVGLCRILFSDLAPSDKAGEITNYNNEELPLKTILEMIIKRAVEVQGADPDKIRHELYNLITVWQDRSNEGDKLSFASPKFKKRGQVYRYLMKHAGDDDKSAWLTMDSLRSVEKECSLYYCE